MSDTCPRAGKLFRSCRFGPRYDGVTPTAEQLRELRGDLVAPLADDIVAATSMLYVRDVCERCGRTIERQPAPKEGVDA